MQRQATRFAHVNAKRLRNATTDSERRLWFRLRRNQFGVKFRRQHPLGSFIADFACLDPKLVVEIDGSQTLNGLPTTRCATNPSGSRASSCFA